MNENAEKLGVETELSETPKGVGRADRVESAWKAYRNSHEVPWIGKMCERCGHRSA